MRQVKYQRRCYKTVMENNVPKPTLITEVGEALFHCFGVDYEEFETGAGNFSTAILELDDGSVISVRADDIQFIS